MKYLDEFRDPAIARRLIQRIQRHAQHRWVLMDVCGGQTHSLVRSGIELSLQDSVELIHGPGCPVCVTPVEVIDFAIALSQRPRTIVASFGDMLRVPGSGSSLLESRGHGGRVRIVYSPADAVRMAQQEPDSEVVFLGVGFETTSPSTALAVLQANQAGLEQLYGHTRPCSSSTGDGINHAFGRQSCPGIPGGRTRLCRDRLSIVRRLCR